MLSTTILSKRYPASLNWILKSIFGAAIISLASMVQIPTFPVVMTLQTLALFVIALTFSPKEAMGSAIFYLGGATMGLPLLSGVANPLWFMGAYSGYLISFPFVAYLVSFLSTRWTSKAGKMGAILCGQCVLYTLGLLFLVPFIGAKSALMGGVIFFIPSAFLKAVLAISLTTKRV